MILDTNAVSALFAGDQGLELAVVSRDEHFDQVLGLDRRGW